MRNLIHPFALGNQISIALAGLHVVMGLAFVLHSAAEGSTCLHVDGLRVRRTRVLAGDRRRGRVLRRHRASHLVCSQESRLSELPES